MPLYSDKMDMNGQYIKIVEIQSTLYDLDVRSLRIKNMFGTYLPLYQNGCKSNKFLIIERVSTRVECENYLQAI